MFSPDTDEADTITEIHLERAAGAQHVDSSIPSRRIPGDPGGVGPRTTCGSGRPGARGSDTVPHGTGVLGPAAKPHVTVIVPVRNEVRFAMQFLDAVLSQEVPEGGLEIIIADGMSDDGTREILDAVSRQSPYVRVIENLGKIVSTGLNAAIRAARGSVIIRLDCHTEYAPDYVVSCLAVLQSAGADNVGGPWRARGRGYCQTAIALAFQSPFSSGGAGSHREDYEGEVDSVYLGCWHRETLLQLGLFDEGLVRNQDDELNLRLIRAGGRIWQSPTIRSWYCPRPSIGGLFGQYMQYGYWKVRVIQKHHLPASIRHLVPGGFVACLLLLALAAPVSMAARSVLVGLLALYSVGDVAAAIVTCWGRDTWKYVAVMPLVFGAFHFGYGWGFLRGAIDFILLKRGGRAAFGELTR